MSEPKPSYQSDKSKEERWYAGFDVVDTESIPISEWPEDDGFHLICPVDGCEHGKEFKHLGKIKESGWTKLSMKDEILTDGTTLKQAYCPAHSLEETEETVLEIREGLGIPLDR